MQNLIEQTQAKMSAQTKAQKAAEAVYNDKLLELKATKSWQETEEFLAKCKGELPPAYYSHISNEGLKRIAQQFSQQNWSGLLTPEDFNGAAVDMKTIAEDRGKPFFFALWGELQRIAIKQDIAWNKDVKAFEQVQVKESENINSSPPEEKPKKAPAKKTKKLRKRSRKRMSRVITCSPSTLEAYRQFKTGAPFFDQEKFLKQIKKEEEKNIEALSIGLAYHDIIENGINDLDIIEIAGEKAIQVVDGRNLIRHTFIESQYKPALEFRAQHPGMIYEIEAQPIQVQIDDISVIMRMRKDGLEGLTLHEQKTSTSKFPKDYFTYRDSVQWRVYCLEDPNIQKVQYNIFQFKAGARTKRKVELKSFEYIPDGSEKEYVKYYLREFVKFVKRHDLFDYLTFTNYRNQQPKIIE
jgi:hypothetical protein